MHDLETCYFITRQHTYQHNRIMGAKGVTTIEDLKIIVCNFGDWPNLSNVIVHSDIVVHMLKNLKKTVTHKMNQVQPG